MEFENEVRLQSPVRGKRVLGWIFAIILFFLYSFLAWRAPSGVFNSPDEMANYYFVGRVHSAHTLKTFEPLEGTALGRVHPRAISVMENFLVPQSFHGLPVLYGIVSFLGGLAVVPFLTPLVAVLAVCAWSRIMARVSGELAGRYSAVILSIIPAWWYYADRGLYHNILFTACLVFGAFFFVVKPLHFRWHGVQSVINGLLAGLFIGLAVWVRTAEIIWITAAIALLVYLFRKKISLHEVVVFALGVVVGFAPALFINHGLYGHALSIGYVPPEASTLVSAAATASETAKGLVSQFWNLFHGFTSLAIPFGIHPRTALINFFHYFIELPWAMAIVLVAACLWTAYQHLASHRTRTETALTILFLGITGWLVTVYGSWVIHDNPDPDKITIGISYSRYWLPSFVLASGIMGSAFAAWARLIRRWSLRWGGVFLVFLLALFSFQIVFFSKGDGLFAVQKTLILYAATKQDVLSQTTANSIIVVDRGDKIFFPERSVITPLRDDSTYEVLGPLSKTVPLYYYGITLTESDLKYQNEVRLAPTGLQLKIINSYGNESLYRFMRQ